MPGELSAAFVAAGGVAPSDAARFEAELTALYAACAAELRGVMLPPVELAAALGRAGAAAEALGEAPVRDVFLATACRLGDHHALAHFEATFMAELPRLLGRFRLTPVALDELRQELAHKLFVGAAPKIAQYAGKRSLGAWFRVVATRAAIDRGRAHADGARAVPDELAATGDLELEYLRRRYEGAFADALRDAVLGMDADTRALLRLHFVDGVGIDGLATLHAIHRSSAHRWLVKAKAELRARTEELLRARLGLEQRELESLAGVVERDLELSIRTLFRTRV